MKTIRGIFQNKNLGERKVEQETPSLGDDRPLNDFHWRACERFSASDPHTDEARFLESNS